MCAGRGLTSLPDTLPSLPVAASLPPSRIRLHLDRNNIQVSKPSPLQDTPPPGQEQHSGQHTCGYMILTKYLSYTDHTGQQNTLLFINHLMTSR